MGPPVACAKECFVFAVNVDGVPPATQLPAPSVAIALPGWKN